MAHFDFEALDLAISSGELTLGRQTKKLANSMRLEVEDIRLQLARL